MVESENGEGPEAVEGEEAPSDVSADRTPNGPPVDSTNSSDSGNFLRCSDCVHAEAVDASAGTLLCRKHNMHVNAEADEIPDDCTEFQARCPAEGERSTS